MDEQEGVFLKPSDHIRVTKMNHIVEVQHMEHMNRKNPIKKLDKDTYVNLDTGEIKEFEHIETRKDSYSSIKQTFKKIRYLINNNFIGSKNELHVTLTYKENMTDSKQLYKDFQNYMDRLRYAYKKETTLDYMCVVEPQARGAWHCHVLLRFNDLDTIFIENKIMTQLWGNGFVTIHSLKDIDNIGAYLSAYLADVELTEESGKSYLENHKDIGKTEILEKVVGEEKKKFIKGGRLHMYPPGMNLYRRSKGITFPERVDMKYKDIKKVVGSAKPHYQKSYEIESDDFKNTITFHQYNLKR